MKCFQGLINRNLFFNITVFVLLVIVFAQAVSAQTTFGGNAQHTGVFAAPAQPLNTIKWQTDIDLNNAGLAHYGSPVISANNTVFVPVKISATGFSVDAFDGATGIRKYSVATDYIMPVHNWIPPYNLCIVGTRLYFAGAGGTMFHIDNIDSNSPSAAVRDVFYTSLANYNANKASFDNTVFANTPITADSHGNIFFGFRVQGGAPAPLNTTQSGLARISSTGVGSFVLAGTATNDALINQDSHSAGPALSNDQQSLYIPFKASSNAFYSYLVELNPTTLATKHTVFLRDPRNGAGARITDDSTSTPMVAPDGDVYFGVFGNTSNGSRGFLLRFSGDLQTTKTPGAFGWDYTPGIVPASMVPAYLGTSSYLLFCKYNDYAFADGSGVNRVAILDPNATQLDPHSSALNMVEMAEVLTLIGPTPDNVQDPNFPFAVQEFCINAPAINPATKSVFFDSEDGHIYRWNLVTNAIDQAVALSPGIGQPYVPTVIGPDGTLYTLNGGNFFAVGAKSDVSMTIRSVRSDVRFTVVGDPVTFTATVTPTAGVVTGTVTFVDVTYNGVSPVTTVLASNVPLDPMGQATITTSALAAGGNNFGNHFVTATYNGDPSHQSTSVTMVQKVHSNNSVLVLGSNNPVSNPGQAVSFVASVSSVPGGAGTPTGMVTFLDGALAIGQVPLNASGQAVLQTSSLGLGVHNISAIYASDTRFRLSFDQTQQFVGPVVQFNNSSFTAAENAGHINVQISLVGTAASPVTVNYATSDQAASSPCSSGNGQASSRCDYLITLGSVTFQPGETSKTIAVPIMDDAFVEGNESFAITLSSISGASLGLANATLTITDNDVSTGTNPIDESGFFVRQHYLDFLNREPDTNGFNFWKNEIDQCGANAQCVEVKRINVSAAFFVSIEFQETGYLVYRVYKSAFGNLPGAPVPVVFSDFIRDTQQISKGVLVNVGDWQTQLEANKQAYTLAFVQRADFLAAFPNSMTATEFVSQLNSRAGNVLSQAEQDNLVTLLGATPSDVTKRSQVLRAVAEDAELKTAEFNRAFVLMQYFGYLRRNPNDLPDSDFTGYNSWLAKLNLFNGNYIQAEMVKAFIASDEYRHRFGP